MALSLEGAPTTGDLAARWRSRKLRRGLRFREIVEAEEAEFLEGRWDEMLGFMLDGRLRLVVLAARNREGTVGQLLPLRYPTPATVSFCSPSDTAECLEGDVAMSDLWSVVHVSARRVAD